MSSINESYLTTKEIVSVEKQPHDIQKIVTSLRLLLEGDEEEQRETFSYLKNALEEDHTSNRRLFS